MSHYIENTEKLKLYLPFFFLSLEPKNFSKEANYTSLPLKIEHQIVLGKKKPLRKGVFRVLTYSKNYMRALIPNVIGKDKVPLGPLVT